MLRPYNQLCRDVCSHRITVRTPLDGRRWGVQGRAARPQRGSMTSPVYYVDGRFVPADQQRFPGRPGHHARLWHLRFPAHLSPRALQVARARAAAGASSAEQIGLAMPWSVGEVEAIVHETNDRNGYDDARSHRRDRRAFANLMMPEQQPRLAVMAEPISIPPERQYAQGVGVTTAHGAHPAHGQEPQLPRRHLGRGGGARLAQSRRSTARPTTTSQKGALEPLHLPHGQAAHA